MDRIQPCGGWDRGSIPRRGVKMKKYWFKAKRYGYGWYPATWQGWLILLVYIAIVALNFYRIDLVSHSASDVLINFISQTLILTIILIIVCAATGEKARWRWG